MHPARGVLLTVLATVAALTGCSRKDETAGDRGGLTKVRFQTDWFPEPEHGGYYQALARGWYAAEGLDVEILPGGPNAAIMTAVALGRADLGMANGDDVIVAVARGVPIRIVAAEMQRDAQGILYHEDNPIRSLSDLDGRTIMAGVGAVWLQYVQKHYGIKFNIIPLVGNLGRFLADPRFIQQCFVTNEPFYVRQRGVRAGALLIAAEGGYEPYRVMFAGVGFIDRRPETVRRFVRASLKGWADYLQGDPQPAHTVLAKLRPDLSSEFMNFSRQAMLDHQLVAGNPRRDERLGQLTPQRLQRQIGLLQEVGVLDKPVGVDNVATFEFLPDECFPGGQRRR
jgi:NitT/TauT family transport system substrate-binding protein